MVGSAGNVGGVKTPPEPRIHVIRDAQEFAQWLGKYPKEGLDLLNEMITVQDHNEQVVKEAQDALRQLEDARNAAEDAQATLDKNRADFVAEQVKQNAALEKREQKLRDDAAAYKREKSESEAAVQAREDAADQREADQDARDEDLRERDAVLKEAQDKANEAIAGAVDTQARLDTAVEKLKAAMADL